MSSLNKNLNMKFDCISSKPANENQFIILKEYQKEQDTSTLKSGKD